MKAETRLLHWIGKPRSAFQCLVIFVIALAAATAGHYVLGMFVAIIAPFAFYFPAILIIASTGGLAFGILAIAASVAIVSYLFLGIQAMPTPEDFSAVVALGVFSVTGIFIAWAASALRNALIRRRRAEDAHRMISEERAEFFRTLDAVLAHAPLGYGFIDRNNCYAQVNGELARIFGVRAEYIVGRPVSDFPPLNAQNVQPAIERVFETGKSVSEIELVRETADDPGAMRAWLAGFFPVCDQRGGVDVVGAALLDIGGLKRAERAMALSERKFRAVAEAMPQLVWSALPDGSYDYYNQRCVDFAGVAPDSGGWKELLHPDDRERTKQLWEHSLATGEIYEVEYRFKDKSGDYHWFLGRAMPLRDKDGNIERWFGTSTDISEMVADRTAKMAEANARLRGEVQERTRAEERLRAEIQERARAEEQLRQASKMEAVGRLTGGLAHDFNNLLTVVMGNIEAMQRRMKNGGDEKIRNHADFAMQGARRAAALTKRLLAFSRGQPLEPKPVNANDLVSSMTELFARTLGEKVALRTAIVENLWTIEADPNQLEASLLNLVVNARDALPNGGSLTIETSNVELDEKYAEEHDGVTPGQYVAITVSDTGIGMSPETLARVFEPFFTTKPAGQGTGLGLSQIYGFVKQSGGHVNIESEPDAGTKVRIFLPRFFGEAAEGEARPNPNGASDRASVLVVEDDDDVRKYAVSMFVELGYNVLEAADGASALRILESRPEIRFMFTDVGLPGDYNGKELADEAKRRRPYLRVLYTTGYARIDILRQGRLDAEALVVTKPFTFDEFAAKVRAVFDSKDKNIILLVEDEVLVAAVAADSLRDFGFEVVEVTTAAAALDHASRDIAGLKAVIVDIGLPDRKGDELAADLRKLRGDLPIIIATGHSGNSVPKELREADKIAVLGKPYDSSALRKALASVGVPS